MRLFTERGFAATTVEDIAEAADYSVSSFFRLFPNKVDVVFYDVPDRLHELRSTIIELEPKSSLAEAISSVLLANAHAWDSEDGSSILARFRLFHQEPELRARYLEYCAEWEDVLAELLSRGRDTRCDDVIAARMQAAGIISAFRVAMRNFMDRGGPLAAHLELAYGCLATPLLANYAKIRAQPA